MIRRYLLLIALLIVAFAARARLDAPTPATSAEPLAEFPATLGSWTGNDSPLEPEVIRVAAVDDHLNRYYRSSAGEMGLYVGYYRASDRERRCIRPSSVFRAPAGNRSRPTPSIFIPAVRGAR
jgi:Protein of unknown function (DUF3485)